MSACFSAECATNWFPERSAYQPTESSAVGAANKESDFAAHLTSHEATERATHSTAITPAECQALQTAFKEAHCSAIATAL
jgi:hypothetical protein